MKHQNSDDMKSKIAQFRCQIRKKTIQQRKTLLRNEMIDRLNQSYQQKVQILMKKFQISQKQIKQLRNSIQSEYKYELIQILLLKSNQFDKLPINRNRIQSQQLPNNNNNSNNNNNNNNSNNNIQSQLQPSHKHSLQLLIQLYLQLCKDIYNNQKKYKSLPKPYQLQLISVLINFFSFNKYTSLSSHKSFQQYFINFLQLLITVIQSQDLRKNILKWCHGTECFTLIYNCLNGFVNVIQYQNVYDLIIKGLQNSNDYSHKKYQAIDCLFKCVNMADYDDIQSILMRKSKIISYIIMFLVSVCTKEQSNTTNQFKLAVRRAIFSLNSMLQTYDKLIYQTALQGAAYVGAKLIMSQQDQWIRGGLMIWIHLANVNHNYGQMHKYLLFDQQLIRLQIWQYLGNNLFIAKHQTYSKYFIQFLSTFISNCSCQQLQTLAQRIQYTPIYGLLDFLIDQFCQSSNNIIIEMSLNAFSSLIYYSKQIEEELNNIDENNQIRRKLSDFKFINKLDEVIGKVNLENQGFNGIEEKIKERAEIIKDYLINKVKCQGQI